MKGFNVMVQDVNGLSWAANYATLEEALEYIINIDKGDYDAVWAQEVYGFEQID